LVAGFSTTSKTRPLIISKLTDYFREKSVIVRSSRLIDELFTFIYMNGRAEAMKGYNDDLVMSLAIGLWVRETALKLRNEQIQYNRQMLSGINKVTSIHNQPLLTKPFGQASESWDFSPNANVNGKKESLKWLL
jgi:hypothetical protein